MALIFVEMNGESFPAVEDSQAARERILRVLLDKLGLEDRYEFYLDTLREFRELHLRQKMQTWRIFILEEMELEFLIREIDLK